MNFEPQQTFSIPKQNEQFQTQRTVSFVKPKFMEDVQKRLFDKCPPAFGSKQNSLDVDVERVLQTTGQDKRFGNLICVYCWKLLDTCAARNHVAESNKTCRFLSFVPKDRETFEQLLLENGLLIDGGAPQLGGKPRLKDNKNSKKQNILEQYNIKEPHRFDDKCDPIFTGEEVEWFRKEFVVVYKADAGETGEIGAEKFEQEEDESEVEDQDQDQDQDQTEINYVEEDVSERIEEEVPKRLSVYASNLRTPPSGSKGKFQFGSPQKHLYKYSPNIELENQGGHPAAPANMDFYTKEYIKEQADLYASQFYNRPKAQTFSANLFGRQHPERKEQALDHQELKKIISEKLPSFLQKSQKQHSDQVNAMEKLMKSYAKTNVNNTMDFLKEIVKEAGDKYSSQKSGFENFQLKNDVPFLKAKIKNELAGLVTEIEDENEDSKIEYDDPHNDYASEQKLIAGIKQKLHPKSPSSK